MLALASERIYAVYLPTNLNPTGASCNLLDLESINYI